MSSQTPAVQQSLSSAGESAGARFGTHAETEFVFAWMTKTNGSTEKSVPPLWNASVCRVEYGRSSWAWVDSIYI